MKKTLCLFISTIALSFLSCTKYEDKILENNNSIFYNDKKLLADIDKYFLYVDSLIEYKGTSIKNNSNSIPLTKPQAAKLYLFLDFYSKTNGEWVPCFVNKESNKIINITEDAIINENYEKLSKMYFYNLLINDNVEIKLIKNRVITKNYLIKPALNSTKTDTYDKIFNMHSTSSSVLAGICDHMVITTWFLKKTYPGFVLENPYPDVDRCDSFLSPAIGDYSQAGFSSAFTPSGTDVNIGILHGNCAGTVKITTNIIGFEIGTIHYVRTDFNINTAKN